MDRGLGIQSVKHGLDEDDLGAALDQPFDLLDIDVGEEIEVDLAIAGIVDVGRQRQGLVGRAECAGDEAAAAVLGLEPPRGLADNAGGGDVDLANEMLGAVIGLADAVGVEAVGRQDLGARLGETLGDRADHVRLGEIEKVVIALLVAGEIVGAAIIGLGELPGLDLGSVGAVLDQDALGRGGLKLRGGVRHFGPLA